MLAKDINPLMEAYANIYNSTTEVVEEDILTNELIEEIIEELVEEYIESGYDLDESLEVIEEATIEYLMELNPYAPAGSKEAKAYNKSTTATKRGEARKAAVRGAVDRVKATVGGVKAAAGIAGSIAKDEVGRAQRAVTHAVQKKKDQIKSGVRGLIGRGLRSVANRAGAGAQRFGEEVDLFDVVLEFLQAEGYAETLEEAEWMMANVIDEEAIEIILGEEELDEAITSEKGKAKAAEMIAARSTPSGRAKSGQGANVAQIKHIQRSNRDGLGGTPPNRKVAGSNWPKSYSGIGGTGNKAAKRAAALNTEEYMDEAQEARNNPEKYEREQSKKTAPVRGERTPMPPRGDKRREDFEKWYAANVR
jgi:hypothetical protein